MTRTDAALAAVREEIEAWRPLLEDVSGLRSLMLVAKFRPDGSVRSVVVSAEGERDRDRPPNGSAAG